MIHHSPYPDVSIPDCSVTRYVLDRTSAFSDRTALVDGTTGKEWTFARFRREILAVAGGLHKHGLRKGDVLAIYSPNLPEYAIVFHAVAHLGGIITTINPLYTTHELTHQLTDSGAIFLVTASAQLERAKQAAQQSDIREIFVLDVSNEGTPYASLLESKVPPPEVSIDPHEDLVVLPYSSGTTGLSKGVMLTHHNVVSNLVQLDGINDLLLMTENDAVIGVLPFYHIYGMVLIMNYTLSCGACVVTMPRFDLDRFFGLIEKYRISRVNVVPPILLAMMNHPDIDRYDLSSLDIATSGAAPLGDELSRKVNDRFGCRVNQGYGLTETSPVTHLNPCLSGSENFGSIGFPIPNTEVRIVDPDSGSSRHAGEPGELWIRGPQVMKGYLNNPEATTATIDQAGWLHTGDIGYVDDNGYFYIVDRLKELIKYKGFQVPPAELEALLLGHPDIKDVAVVPIDDDEAGQVPKAFVVRAGGDFTGQDVMDWVAERVAPSKRIRVVEFIDQIPKSAAGKILRRVLRDRASKK